MTSSPNHHAAAISAGVPGGVGVASSTAFYGCSGPALLGLISPNVIPLTRPVIADSSNGCGRASCEVFSKRKPRICGFKIGSMFAKPSSMAASLPPKKGSEGWQNQTWQGYEDYGGGRSQWSSGGCIH